MLAILKPVFESIWKRRETKIFIGLAMIAPTLILISTFLPKDANFFRPTVFDDYRFTAVSMASSVIGITNSLVLPLISLFYLTYTVFRGEADARTLFLYKDIKRKDIFWAKIVSLIGIVFIYTLALFIITVVYFFARFGYMDYAIMQFWGFIATDNIELVQTFFGEMFSMIVCIFLAAFLSLKKGLGVTMITSFVYLIILAIISRTDFVFLLPLGQKEALVNGASLLPIFATSALVTLVYSSGLAHLTLKHFKGMEY